MTICFKLSEIKKIISFITNIFFPNKCCVCKNLITDKDICICKSCLLEMPLQPQKDSSVKERLYGSPIFSDLFYLYNYSHYSHFSKIIKSFKYKSFRNISKFISSSAIENIDLEKLNIDLIVAVPIEHKKLITRGYNQSLEIAKHIAKHLNKPYTDKIVKRRHSRSQTSLTKRQRMENAKSAFYLNTSFDCDIKGKTILLIDDVLTTGNTLLFCMDELERAGANKVFVFVSAVTT